MRTNLLTVNEFEAAARIIRVGGLVGIPTETVYGLGANGLNPLAVDRIFQAKGRPQDNPLILHIPESSWLERYCEDIPEAAWRLAKRFWPGPLTMILRRKPIVPDVVTAGLDTVGMRCPAHSVCRAVIQAAGVPVAAPSGNLSGKPSPTTARHMLDDMDGRINAILDGGDCQVGVESTIIDLTCRPPRLLRPGGVPLEELQAVLGEVEVDPAVVRPLGDGEQPRAPGMKYRHYAPKARVVLLWGTLVQFAAYLEAQPPGCGVLCFEGEQARFGGHPCVTYGRRDDPVSQAQALFGALRRIDELGLTSVYARVDSPDGVGQAVYNRLLRAAGFTEIRLGWEESAT